MGRSWSKKSIQIHQIIMNLCINAYHAMEETGGSIHVSLANVHFDTEYIALHPAFTQEDYIKLTVSDTGHGMEDAVKERIFEPYFTTKEIGKGSGMGLSVVHGIVKSHGGYITVNSEPNNGTTFHVYIPRCDISIEKQESISIEPVKKGNEHILLVEDEDAVLRMLQQMLKGIGYEVTIQNSGIEALGMFSLQPEKFDLIIIDITMPDITGDLLSKELRNIRPAIPIILLSGFSDMMTEKKAKDIGIQKYLMKPVTRSDLSNTIRSVLDKV